MQTTSELYKSLLSNPRHAKETKLVIAGADYGEADIESLSTSGGLFTGLSMGGTASREINFAIFPKGIIPKQAKVEVYTRLKLDDQVSEWLPKGVFFFSTRKTDARTGLMNVVGYDAMLKAEETWLNNDYDYETWPMPADKAVADIATRMGITVDPRTVLNPAFPVQYPVDDEGDMTMREALSRVAIANAGNWVITDEGKLLLVPLASALGSVTLGNNVAESAPGLETQPITRVELYNEKGDIVGDAGNETGRLLSAENPDGTPEMAAAILEAVSGFTYKPFEATDALLDPAAEIGDAIECAGVESLLIQTDITFDSLYTANISAPTDDEIEDEYPYISAIQREIRRNYAKTYSLITKTSDQILLEVGGEIDELSNTVNSVRLDMDGITLRVEGAVKSAEDAAAEAENLVSEIKLTLDSITLSVENGDTSSVLTLKAGDTVLSSESITFKGIVTLQGLSTAGATEINGDNITTGNISAERINVDELKIKAVYNSLGTRSILSSTSFDAVYIGGESSGTYQAGSTYLLGNKIYIGAKSDISALVITVGNDTVMAPKSWTWGSSANYMGDFYVSDAYCQNLYCYTGGRQIGKVGDPWSKAYVASLYLGQASTANAVQEQSGYLTFNGARFAYSQTSGGIITGFAGNTVHFGGTSATYYIYAGANRLRPSTGPTSTTAYYLGESSYYWHYAYIGADLAKIGYNQSSQIGFFAATPVARQTLSTSSTNMGYTSATSSNYLTVINNIAGILKKYGLIG